MDNHNNNSTGTGEAIEADDGEAGDVQRATCNVPRCANMAKVKGQATATAPNVSLMVSRVA